VKLKMECIIVSVFYFKYENNLANQSHQTSGS